MISRATIDRLLLLQFAHLDELAENIAQHGVLQAVLDSISGGVK